jgi:hypothetical protein
MITRITIQIIMIWYLIGYKFYKEDNWIPTKKTKPKWIVFWIVCWIILPITFMWMALLDVLSGEDK